MDIYCLKCGEPWDLIHVMDNKDEFVFAEENTGKITKCPCCEEVVDLTKEERGRLDSLSALADIMGDDIDGYAAFVEDLDAMGLLDLSDEEVEK
jgi:hypothetical protein